MKIVLKELIEKSGKKTAISYKNKEKRKSFDESYAKTKMNVIKEFNSLKEAAAETKIHSTTIRKSIRGNKISYDYVFRFKDAV